MLRNAGFEAELSVDGRLRGVDLSKVDVLITDMLMPQQDGMEVLLRLKKDAPNVRTIVMTGAPGALGVTMLMAARTLHADITLAKPFSNDAIVAACTTLLAPKPAAFA